MQYSLDLRSLWIVFFATVALLLTSCAPNKGAGATAKVPDRSISTPIDSHSPGSTNPGSSSTPITNNSSAPLEFGVTGMGNHPQSVCVPAATKLQLRVVPHANMAPLMAYNPYLLNARNGQPLYDGSPAYYNKLRVRLSIPGTAASWDFVASLETPSVSADFSSYLRAVAPTSVPNTSMLTTPEYDVSKTIWGSNPSDGLCTYWEQQLGRCTQVSSILRGAETVTCPTGSQKIMITMIVSDYPCAADPVGWCQGGALQIVPDYQQWSLTVQAVTENTLSFR